MIPVREYEREDPGHRQSRNRTFSLLASAGTGKSFLAETLIYAVRARGGVVLACASSGIAATLLPAGQTANRIFGIPVPVLANSTSVASLQSRRAELLRRASLIVWDESIMAHHHAFTVAHRLQCELRSYDPESATAPVMGGVPTVLMGDVSQILPVVRRGTEASITAACLLRWPRWRQTIPVTLPINERVRQREVGDAGSEGAH